MYCCVSAGHGGSSWLSRRGLGGGRRGQWWRQHAARLKATPPLHVARRLHSLVWTLPTADVEAPSSLVTCLSWRRHAWRGMWAAVRRRMSMYMEQQWRGPEWDEAVVVMWPVWWGSSTRVCVSRRCFGSDLYQVLWWLRSVQPLSSRLSLVLRDQDCICELLIRLPASSSHLINSRELASIGV